MALGKSGQLVITNKGALSAEVGKRGSIGKFLNKPHWAVVVLMLIAAGLVGWFWLKPSTSIITANGPILATLTLLTALNLFIRWLRWHFLTRCFNLRLPTKNSLKLYLVTLPTLITPLYLGELLRAAWVNTRYPHAWTTLSKVWLIERLADAFVLGFLLLALRLHWGVTLGLMTPLILLAVVSSPAKSKPGRLKFDAPGWPVTGQQWLRDPLRARKLKLLRPTRAAITPTVWSITLIASSAAWLIFGLALWLVLPGLRLPAANLAWLGLDPSGFSLAAQTQLHGGDKYSTLNAARLSRPEFWSDKAMLCQPKCNFGTPIPQKSKPLGFFWLGTGGVTLLLGSLAMIRWRGQLATLLTPPQSNQHFDAIAPCYNQEIPTHIRERLVLRKVAAMGRVLQASKLPINAHGLDLGCGPGWYASQMAWLGYRISACDFIPRQIAATRRQAEVEQASISPQVAEAGVLPYADNSFDFIYSINLLHHLASPQAQQETLVEVVRVLKPDGLFFLQEINTHNPLFALYMGYIFPLVRNIDNGTEHWLKPSALPRLKNARWSDDTIHFTFLPDFTPQRLLPLLAGLEKFLETRLPRWSAHYVACLVKEGSQ